MNVLLVHGSFGKPFENWFPWLECELSKENIECIVPSFPTPRYQIYEHWDKLMSYYLNRGFVDRNTILVGHSCGAVFIVKYVLQHKLNIKGMLTFSGYNNFISGNEMMDNLNISFYMNDDDLRDIKKYVNKVFAFYGDDDPNIPQQILHDYAEKLGAIEHCVPKAGHFNSTAGYNTCSFALDTILKEFT